jgi:ribosomal protein S18 acetylase RimI-like enzyme
MQDRGRVPIVPFESSVNGGEAGLRPAVPIGSANRSTQPRRATTLRLMTTRVSTDGVAVRDARLDDLTQVLGLYEQLAEERPAARPAEHALAVERFQQINAQPGRALLVAVVDERVVGTADLLIVPNLTHGGEPWGIVENVVVDRSARRRGTGRALMAEITGRCRSAGCYKVQLLSRKHRHEAHAFYRSVGFEPLAEGFRFYIDRSPLERREEPA